MSRGVVVGPRMSAYSEASKAVFEVFNQTAPLVEGLSIDEAFLDVRGMSRIAGPPRNIAARLRRDVSERVGLPITVGVARTKFLAKVASGVAKPDGLLVDLISGEGADALGGPEALARVADELHAGEIGGETGERHRGCRGNKQLEVERLLVQDGVAQHAGVKRHHRYRDGFLRVRSCSTTSAGPGASVPPVSLASS